MAASLSFSLLSVSILLLSLLVLSLLFENTQYAKVTVSASGTASTSTYDEAVSAALELLQTEAIREENEDALRKYISFKTGKIFDNKDDN